MNYVKLFCTVLLINSTILLSQEKNIKNFSGNFLKTQHHFGDRTTASMVNVGNWNYWAAYDGISGQNPNNTAAGQFPGFWGFSGPAAIYFDGIVFGGYHEGDTLPRVGGGTYSSGLTPGWVENGAPINMNDDRVAIYRIRKDYKNYEYNLWGLQEDATSTNQELQAVYEQYEHDWLEWPADLGAPFVDENGDGEYDPAIDTPGLANADQVLWYVVNDFDSVKTNAFAGSQPLGLEIQVTIWVYNQPLSSLGQTVFKKYKIINKSTVKIDSMFFGQWSDIDIGYYKDDYAGCVVESNLAFAYNANITDKDFSAFGLPPTAVGYSLLQGPLVNGENGQDLNRNGLNDSQESGIFDFQKTEQGYINLPMTSFSYFTGDDISEPEPGNPDGTLAWYNLLNGFTATTDLINPTPYTTGNYENGSPTKFPLSGDPVLGTGDLDGKDNNFAQGDRRILLSCGPFTMQPGETQEIAYALVGGHFFYDNSDNITAYIEMRNNNQYAHYIYNRFFDGLPEPPPAPTVEITNMDEAILLNWDIHSDRVEQSGRYGFEFEGYNVYQLPKGYNTVLTEAIKIATFDVDNGIQTIRGYTFLEEYGQSAHLPLQHGTDSGIKRSLLIDKNYVNGSPMYNGTDYYYAVTAYNYNPDPASPVRTIESDWSGSTRATPQPLKPGEKTHYEANEEIGIISNNSSTGSVSVKVINPKEVVSANYTVSINTNPNYTIEEGDTIATWYRWALADENSTILSDQDNLSGDDSYPIKHGIQVKVIGPKVRGYADWGFDGQRWVSGSNWGGRGLFGGLDAAYAFRSGANNLAEDELYPVQMVWQDQADADENGFIGQGPVYRRDLGYNYNGNGIMPFAVYDMRNTENPRRVNVAFVEDADHGSANQIWDMGWDGTTFADSGGHEYIYIMDSDYDGGAAYNDINNALETDAAYVIWPAKRGSRAYLDAAFTLNIYANIPLSPGDMFTFSTIGFETNDNASLETSTDKINVFPNPYYFAHTGESSSLEKFVTFTRLPQKAIIRIFNLGGTLIRKLEKDDTSQFLKWDLKNEARYSVGNGMYIAHIKLPDLKKDKVLKFMIIRDDEILRFY